MIIIDCPVDYRAQGLLSGRRSRQHDAKYAAITLTRGGFLMTEKA